MQYEHSLRHYHPYVGSEIAEQRMTSPEQITKQDALCVLCSLPVVRRPLHHKIQPSEHKPLVFIYHLQMHIVGQSS